MTTAPSHDQRPMRFVQVGAGAMGRAWMAAVAASADAELVGLVDIDVQHAEAVARELGLDIIVGNSVTDVAHRSTADAVLNITVPPAHHTVTTEALFAGYPVLSEKPLAPTLAEALSLIAAQEVTGCLLMTSQSRRYYPELAEYKALVAAIDVGILATEFYRAPRFGGFRDEMAHPLLIDMAIHGFDAARYLLDAEPISVYCREFNPPWSWYKGEAATVATFEFAGGVQFTYSGSWCSPGLETSWNGSWRASGAFGTATWDGDHRPVAELTGSPVTPSLFVPDAPREIEGALAEFIAAVRDGTTPASEAHSNVLSLAMVEAAIASSTLDTAIRIDRVLDDAYREAVLVESRDDVLQRLRSWGSVKGHLMEKPLPRFSGESSAPVPAAAGRALR